MSEKFASRGIGLEWNLPCFVTGRKAGDETDLKDNIAAFVASKTAGKRVVAMFNGLARLDFRPSEPKWIQVKVGVTKENLPALEALHNLVRQNDNKITPEIIAEAKTFAPKPA
jgi:hypothetical protein